MNSCGGGVSSGGPPDSRVETISRLAQWRIDTFGPCSYRRSEPFKLGIWNWYLSVEKSRSMVVRLFPEPGRVAKEQPPLARFVIRVSWPGPPRRSCESPVQEQLLRSSDDFAWPVDVSMSYHGRFTVDVEFLDLKVGGLRGDGDGDSSSSSSSSVVSSAAAAAHGTASRTTALGCLSHMLADSMHTDVTINTSDGVLGAHKAVLASSSPVFHRMFLHDLREKESSTVDIDDMCVGSCSALLAFVYGAITQEQFLAHRLPLLAAANKYAIADLRACCEDSLLEDITSANVLERLHVAWLYQLDRLKKGCLAYLFVFGKIYDVKDHIQTFFRTADRELIAEMFQEILTVWKPI